MKQPLRTADECVGARQTPEQSELGRELSSTHLHSLQCCALLITHRHHHPRLVEFC